MNTGHWILYDSAGLGMKKEEISIILFASLKPVVKCSRRTEFLSTNCKINVYCINKFTKMLPVELIHIFDSHSSFFPLGLTSSSFVFMEFYLFLKCFLAEYLR